MQCGIGHCGHCQLGPTLVCRDGPVYRWTELEPWLDGAGAVSWRARASRSSPSGSSPPATAASSRLLDCEDELLAARRRGRDRLLPRGVAARSSRAPTTSRWSRARSRRRTTPSASSAVRRQSRALITIGACATAGGIQALRNFADVEDFTALVYASPGLHRDARAPRRRSAPTSPSTSSCTGCPINKRQLLEVISAPPDRRRPAIARAQRLHGMQAARQRLRDGRARHRLPRARSRTPAAARSVPPMTAAATAASGRWRRRTPARSTRWLRELGSDDATSSRVYRTFNAARRRVPRRRARRHERELSARSRTDYLARVEGEGAMYVSSRAASVTEVKLRIYEPPRFFEAFLRGRAFTEAPDITARICGICPVAYQMSAVRAMEDACGVAIDDGRSARCAGCSTAASGSRATRCTSTCCTRPTSSATTASIAMAARPPRARRARRSR